jgi:putative transposase
MTANRKKLKHYHEPGDLHELTFSCYERRTLLDDEKARTLLCESIDRAISGHDFRLVAFVLMPEHVHLLVCPMVPKPEIDKLLFAIKRPFSYRMKKHFDEIGDPRLSELIVRERPGKMTFRFWEEGAGYDRNISLARTILASIDYIHLNPVRRGSVNRARDWKWSSCRWYESDKQFVDADLPTIHGLPDFVS